MIEESVPSACRSYILYPHQIRNLYPIRPSPFILGCRVFYLHDLSGETAVISSPPTVKVLHVSHIA